ncbi:MAG: hypothetical protein FJ390_01330 [Verrucomicrobia bacterium]|nr:hypothetical protein [Verrucomicrobiota bacterium]
MNKKSWLHHLEVILRHLVARVAQALAIFIVIGIPVLLLVVHFHGLGEGIRQSVEKALSGKFYDVKVERLSFTLGSGLKATDLRILEKNETHRLLVHANRVTILPQLAALAHGKIEVESFQLHHATIDVPLGRAEEPRLRLDHVEATIVSPPGQISVNDAQFNLCGIHVCVRGNFLNPKTFAPNPVPSDGPGKIAQTIVMIQKTLKQLHWEEAPPILEIEITGDLTHLESLRADRISLRGGSCRYEGMLFNSIAADMEYGHQTLKLQQLKLEDRVGELHSWGNIDFQKQEATMNFSGTADVMSVASFALKKDFSANDWHWKEAPHLEGSVGADWKTAPPVFHGEVHVQAGAFSYRGVEMDHLTTGAIFNHGTFLMRDLDIAGTPGSLHLDFMAAPQDQRARINLTLVPQLLEPAARGGLQKTLATMNFKEPLHFTFEGTSPGGNFFSWQGAGTLQLGPSSMRDAWIDSLSADFQLKEGAFTFQNILTKIGETKAEGSCIYDVKNQEVRFPGLHANLDPVPIMMWIDPHIAQSLLDYRFHEPPVTDVTGVLGLKDPQKNNFRVQLKAPQGLDYTLLKKNLTFQQVAGEILIKKQELLVDIPQASLFGGRTAIKATVSIVPGDGRYGADVTLDSVDFKSLTKLYFEYDTSQGKMSGDYHFTTVTGDDYAMKGNGRMLIKDGSVYSMPIFGPLSVLMNDVIPGLGYQAANQATADFTVEKGVINTKNLSIHSAAFTMIGAGDIFYLEDRMNMSVRLNVRGIPGIIFFPVSKLFEYISDGSAKHPVWRAKYIPLPPATK